MPLLHEILGPFDRFSLDSLCVESCLPPTRLSVGEEKKEQDTRKEREEKTGDNSLWFCVSLPSALLFLSHSHSLRHQSHHHLFSSCSIHSLEKILKGISPPLFSFFPFVYSDHIKSFPEFDHHEAHQRSELKREENKKFLSSLDSIQFNRKE